MTETFTRWDAVDSFKSADDIIAYLDACIEEDPGDGSLIRAALSDIARARNFSRMAREIGMSREGLYKALSDDGNPSFATILKILHAMNLDLQITPREERAQ